MTAEAVARFFKTKGVGRVWFLVVYSLGFGVSLAIIMPLLFQLMDVVFFDDPPSKIRPFSVVIQLLLFGGLGYYIANSGWPKTTTNDKE